MSEEELREFERVLKAQNASRGKREREDRRNDRYIAREAHEHIRAQMKKVSDGEEMDATINSLLQFHTDHRENVNTMNSAPWSKDLVDITMGLIDYMIESIRNENDEDIVSQLLILRRTVASRANGA